jgi:hypothetical protein
MSFVFIIELLRCELRRLISDTEYLCCPLILLLPFA